MSFKYKTIIGIALIQAVMLSLLVWNSMLILISSNEQELIKRAETTSKLFAATNKDAVLSSDLATLEAFVSEVLEEPGIIYARVLGRDNVVLAEDGNREAINRPFKADTNYSEIDDGVFDAFAVIEEAGVGYGYVEIGFSINEIQKIISEARRWSIAFAGVGIIFTAFFSLILGIYLTRAISQLRTGTERIADGDLGHQIKVRGNDELAIASSAFNEMSLRLQQLYAAQRLAEEELIKLNETLEMKVQERTDDLQRTQGQMLQHEKLASLGKLAAGLAHEMNTPLTGLLSMLKHYKKSSAKDPEQDKELSLMLNACKHMAKIVRDFGLFSGRSMGEFSKLDLSDVIEAALSLVTNQIKQKSIKTIKEYSDDPLTVNGNMIELQQVILNIVSNAIDAMSDGGSLVIRTRLSDDREKAIIKFKDDGAGIDKKHINNIFEPFFTTKPQGRGTGLGLSVSYTLIKNQKGDITVKSDAANGTEFTIILPAVD